MTLISRDKIFFNVELRMNVSLDWSRITNALKICSHHLKSVQDNLHEYPDILSLDWYSHKQTWAADTRWQGAGNEGRGRGIGLGPLVGETTECLYRSHKFPKDNIVTLSTFTIFLNPIQGFLTYFLDQVLWFQERFYMKNAHWQDVKMSSQNSLLEGQPGKESSVAER